MERLNGNAWRDRLGTHVQMAGLLAGANSHATIVDIYPLGRICYESGPDCAEIFIDEWRDIENIKNQTQPSPPNLTQAKRWAESILIDTQAFDRLRIFINGEEELEIEIGVSSSTGGEIMSWPRMPVRTDLGAVFKTR